MSQEPNIFIRKLSRPLRLQKMLQNHSCAVWASLMWTPYLEKKAIGAFREIFLAQELSLDNHLVKRIFRWDSMAVPNLLSITFLGRCHPWKKKKKKKDYINIYKFRSLRTGLAVGVKKMDVTTAFKRRRYKWCGIFIWSLSSGIFFFIILLAKQTNSTLFFFFFLAKKEITVILLL